jgi:hypothetical protein
MSLSVSSFEMYPMLANICFNGRSCKLLSNPPAVPAPPPAMFPNSAARMALARSYIYVHLYNM